MTTFTLTIVFMYPNGLNAALDFSGAAFFCNLNKTLKHIRSVIGVTKRLM